MSAEMLCGCGEVQGTTNDAKTKAKEFSKQDFIVEVLKTIHPFVRQQVKELIVDVYVKGYDAAINEMNRLENKKINDMLVDMYDETQKKAQKKANKREEERLRGER